MDRNQELWTNNLSVLFTNIELIPTKSMSKNEKLNVYTRLLLLITILFYFLNYEYTGVVFCVGLVFILFLHSCKKEGFQLSSNNDSCIDCVDEELGLLNAKYERTLPIQFNHDDSAKRTYANTDFEVTPLFVEDEFRSLWQKEPEDCGYFSMPPEPSTQLPVEKEEQGQCNYIFRTIVDTNTFNEGLTGLNSQKANVEQGFVDSTMTQRNLIHEYNDQLTRDRKHNCSDVKLMRMSAGGGSTF